jgi:indolepyruvate decarboxylase
MTIESEDLTVARYLVNRLAARGVRHFFGVPGDYNLHFLDTVIAHPEVDWVGTANELNAAYAADGYARCRGAAVLVTTYGVGELSAINGLAGSYAEYVPVLHIVGAPSSSAKRARAVLHHTLGDGDFEHFSRMHAEVTVSRAWLTSENAAEEIDRVIGDMLFERRPGYIVIPTDVVSAPVRVPRLPVARRPYLDLQQLEAFSAHAQRLLRDARRPAMLADFLVDRFGLRERLQKFLNASALPHATLLLGKAMLDESSPTFVGTYVGAASEAGVREAIEEADTLITAGVLFTDVLTAGFSHVLQPERLIEIHPFHASVAGREYRNLPMSEALRALEGIFARRSTPVVPPYEPATGTKVTASSRLAQPTPTANLTQAIFWDRIQQLLRPGDLVVAEQGTASFGLGPKRFPADVVFLAQPLWGSIGYALPAAFGAGTALRGRRLVIFVGDGAALLSVQEIGSLMRDGLKPLIFLLNNAGYTIERAIHGAEQPYNDIPRWDWTLVPMVMGPDNSYMGSRVQTSEDLDRALSRAEHADSLVILEVMLPKHDVPELLSRITRGVASVNGSASLAESGQ